MAVNYSTTLKSTRMAAVIAAVDAGSGPGTLEICTASYASVLAIITLADPSFTESGGVITMAGMPRSDTSADNTGTAAIARIKDSNGTVVISGLTVGVGTGDIQLNSVSISAAQTVTITAGTITHSA
jgi:hypothetical protein